MNFFQTYGSCNALPVICPYNYPQGCYNTPLPAILPQQGPTLLGPAPHVSWKQSPFSALRQLLVGMAVAFGAFCPNQLVVRRLQTSPRLWGSQLSLYKGGSFRTNFPKLFLFLTPSLLLSLRHRHFFNKENKKAGRNRLLDLSPPIN